MYSTFTKEPLHIDDVVVYLKNERTGSSTVRKCKFIGQVVGFVKTKVKIHRFSPPDTFVTPEEIQDFGIDTICLDDVVYIIISKYQEDMHTKTLMQLNDIANKYKRERDAAIRDMECWLSEGKTCPCCKHNFEDEDTSPCKDNGLVYGCSRFEWRGLQE